MGSGERSAAQAFARNIKVSGSAKTEREAVAAAQVHLVEAGFRPLPDTAMLRPGDKVYTVNRRKALIASVIGKNPAASGFNIIGAHIDSPRLDLKPQPLYEEDGLALLKTHYYGGIKKYQWLSVPLAMHGVVIKSDGTTVSIVIRGKARGTRFTWLIFCRIWPRTRWTRKWPMLFPGKFKCLMEVSL